jgi:hydrogenase nickel incorporation protein HypA/HybF
MHELGLAEEIFKNIEELAKKNNLKKITKIRIKVGEQAGVEEELLEHSLIDHRFPGTLAEGAELEIVQEKVRFRCPKCNQEYENITVAKCNSCGNENLEIIAGTEIYIDHLEGED